MSNKVWFVTGASKGLGLALVKQLLAKGYAVAATSRSLGDLTKAVGNADSAFLPLAVDLKNESNVHAALAQTVKQFGRVDVVVNNAGYGQMGALEELSDAEARDNFEINVFGLLNVIRHAMPYLREQKSGHILNISSVGGITGNFPGCGIYCSTKFAVEGLSESLAAEVKRFGVNVTIVEPGYFRTEFLTAGSLGLPQNELAVYEEVRTSLQLHTQQINRNQPGDPDKAATAMIDITGVANPPLRLALGEDAYALIHAKIDTLRAELEQWKAVTVSTNL